MFLDAIPGGVAEIMKKIKEAGQEAYLVGGCVRDRYRGIEPQDHDLTTSALPEELMEIFAERRLILTGLKHGTVAILTDEGPVEVTTYRQDGTYSDHRHPDGVVFTRSLREDLARRDFTMNAMALDETGRWVDPFGGRADLDAGIIRCVGEAARRFEEDALRILRGLRFASRFGFSIEEETARAMRAKASLLRAIAPERIFAEFCGLLEGTFAAETLREYGVVLYPVLPQLDLSEKNLTLLNELPKEAPLRLAALLPSNAEETLRFLKPSNRFRKTVELLLRERETSCPPERIAVRRRCAELGAEDFITLCRYRQDGEAMALAEGLLEEGACLSVKELAVDGKDLMALGMKGPALGDALAQLLRLVVDGELSNEKEELLSYFK